MNFPHKLYDHSELGNHISETFLPELFRYFLISAGAIRFRSRSYFGKYHVWHERSGFS